jgi:hypothetical protein
MKWTGFMKTLVKWCKQSGKTSSSSLENNLGTLKIPKSKVKNPWNPSKQSWKPQILKQYPQYYFPHVELSKWQGKNWRLWNFIIPFNKNPSIKVHKTKDKIPCFLAYETSHKKKDPKITRRKLKTHFKKQNWKLGTFIRSKPKTPKLHTKIIIKTQTVQSWENKIENP